MTAQRIGTQIQPLTAKGDLLGYSTTPARVAVGSDGQTLVANSGSSTGVSWQNQFMAGKNRIINGDFGVWQRGTSFTNVSSSFNYTADRWQAGANAATTTHVISQQTFTPGTAPVSGYEGTYFFRSTLTNPGSATIIAFYNKIEDVRVFAGQTVTLSFWAKADSARTLNATLDQIFGSGGSTSVSNNVNTWNLTTSWARYSYSITLPSISGKTIGTGSYLSVTLNQAVASGSVLDIWGVQLEAGSVATPFTTATGTVQGELAACQRYYETSYNAGVTPGDGASSNSVLIGTAYTTGSARIPITFKVPKRGTPSITTYRTTVGSSAGKWSYYSGGWSDATGTSIDTGTFQGFMAQIDKTSAFTSGSSYIVSGDWVASSEL